MPNASPIPIAPPPGVVKTEALRAIEGRWSDSQWFRWVGGRPQKRGGHEVQTTDVMSGVPRAMHAWRDLSQQGFLAAGTSKKLYVFEDEPLAISDITPIERTGTLGSNPFTTASGSSIVTVAHSGHTRISGSIVTFSGASVVHGLTLNDSYEVLAVTGANAYTIDAGSEASGTGSGGGASVAYSYEINIGSEAGAYSLGYGVGGYGMSTYGTARESSSIRIEPRIWSLKNYGKLLYAAYNGGTIYTFDPVNLSISGRAEALTNAPTDVRAMFITEERFPFALCDDMTARWPDQEDNTVWTPADGNTANQRRLTDGTKLVGGLALGQRVSLVWSDSALYLFQYTGSSTVYDSRKVSTNCGLISPNAAVSDSDGVVYWMSPHSFHLYAGGVQETPNVDDIKDFVFDNLRTDQPYLCWAYYDAKYHEVNFFYVPVGELTPRFSVTYHIKDQCWSPNDWSAWPRASAARFQHGDTRPYLGGTDGYVYLQETGVDADADAIAGHLTLSPIEMADGANNIELDGLRIDLHGQVGDVTLEVEAYDTLRGGVIDSATKTITEDDELIDLRVAGRLVGLTLTTDTVGGYFRWGKPIALVKGGGARR